MHFMNGTGHWLGRGCLLLIMVVATPFVLIALIVLAGLALGAFTVSLPFLFVAGLIAGGIAGVGLGGTLAIRRIMAQRKQDSDGERPTLGL
jgi:hypothetical protein